MLCAQLGKPLGRAGMFLHLSFLLLCLISTVAESNTFLAPNKNTNAHENAGANDYIASYGTAVPLLSSPLQVAVAANFAKPLHTIANDYFKNTGQKVSITVSSSGTLFAQLTHGAQFDVFLSADTARPNALVEVGRVNAEDVHVYAKGRLVFLSSKNVASVPHFTAELLKGKKLAIANPKLAPYGEAAKQYLANTHQWNTVTPYIVKGKNVLQAYQFFTTGNASYALVAYSLALNGKLMGEADGHSSNVPQRVGAILIPDTLHQPILQSLAVTASSERKAAATAFARYLLSMQVQENLPSWGYLPAGDSLSMNVDAITQEANQNSKKHHNETGKKEAKLVDNGTSRGRP